MENANIFRESGRDKSKRMVARAPALALAAQHLERAAGAPVAGPGEVPRHPLHVLPGPGTAVFFSALRAHTKAPYKIDLLWKMLRGPSRPGRARTAFIAKAFQRPWHITSRPRLSAPGMPGLPCVKAEIRPASPSQYAWPSVLRAAARPKSRFGMLSALRAHTKAPYKTDLLWKTLRALSHAGCARTGASSPRRARVRWHVP